MRGDDAALHGRDAVGRRGCGARRASRKVPALREALRVRGGPPALRRGRDRGADAAGPAREAREPPHLPAGGLRPRTVAVAAALVAATGLAEAHASTPRPVRVLVVGDSVSAALAYQPSMELAVAKGYNV